jgi:hypothetical protein
MHIKWLENEMHMNNQLKCLDFFVKEFVTTDSQKAEKCHQFH